MTADLPDKALVDTNLLVYAYDPTNKIKCQTAKSLLKLLLTTGRLVLSVQSLNEFYNAATRPNKPPSLSHDEAVKVVADLVNSCIILPLTPDVSLRAMDAVDRHGMSLWDALIWAAAKQNSVFIIYTEDIQSALEIEGIRYINPFEQENAS